MAMRDYASMAEYFGQTTTANEKAWPDARYYYAEALQMHKVSMIQQPITLTNS